MTTIIGNWIDAKSKDRFQIFRVDRDLFGIQNIKDPNNKIDFTWFRDEEREPGVMGGLVQGFIGDLNGTDFEENQSYQLLLKSEDYIRVITLDGYLIARFNFHSTDTPSNNFKFKTEYFDSLSAN